MSTKSCPKLKTDIKKKKVLGKGQFGTVSAWAQDKVVKVEACDKIEYTREGFMKDVAERSRLTKSLAARGLAPKTLEWLQCDNACITFMKKVDGDTMKAVLEKTKDKSKTLELIRKSCSAIESMHNLVSVAHGDLHTGNIMVTKKGKIKFIDFAFERRLGKHYDWQFFLDSAVNHAQGASKEEVTDVIMSFVPQNLKTQINF